MKYQILAWFKRILAFFAALSLCGGKPAAPVHPDPNTVSAYDAEAADYRYTVNAGETDHGISDMLFGVFFEDINFAADGGLYAEMVSNRSFEFTTLAADDALYGWQTVGNAEAEVLTAGGLNENNPAYLRLTNPGNGLAGVGNRGFLEGMAIDEADYRFSVYAKSPDESCTSLTVRLTAGDDIAAEGEITGLTAEWQKYTLTLHADRAAAENVRLQVLTAGGAADLDMISLFPAETFMGRENGLRADLAQLVADLSPKFLRFPGGCVIEGVDDDTDYSWKDSIGVGADGLPLAFNGGYGDVAARKQGINLWTDLGATDDPYPSFMSYGLGFYEFFQFAEDIGAAPVPVLNCGLYCQMRGRGPVDMESERFAAYVQDMLDLVEFANGPADSTWGKVRASLGHPEPFGLKYICIGNENEGTDYYERYAAFRDALDAAAAENPGLCGDIELIYSAGAADATHSANYIKSYEYAEDWLAAHPGKTAKDFAAATDQHYYNAPAWFLENADYYDPENYTRADADITATHYGGAIPVFVGEYAARSNTLRAALAEAAYMTGLERNGDIVKMAAYAPLFGNLTASHWRPDLIWFDNSTAYGSVNYEVQKLFGNHTGVNTVQSALEGASVPQQPLTGAVGLGAWYTAAAFDNLRITDAAGKTLEKDDFTLPGLKWKWQFPKGVGGEWKVQNGRMVQSSAWMPYTDTGMVAYLGSADWTDYTFTVDAEKLEGDEGFLIPFAVQDTENCFFWNLGGWGNTVSCLQQIRDGEKSGQLPGTVKPFTAETGKTYKLKVALSGRNVKCWVDDELYIDYTAGSDAEAECYQVAGTDENGSLIVKLVNVTDSPRTFACTVQGAGTAAAVSQLTAADVKEGEDPLDSELCAVRDFSLSGLSERFNYTVPAYSVTVMTFSPAE